MLPLVGLLLAVFLDLFSLGMLRPVLPLYVGAMLGAVGGGCVYEQLGPRIPFFVKAAFAGSAALLAGKVRVPSTIQAGGVRGGVRTAVGLPGLLPISVVNMVLFMADVGILAILFPLFLHARGLPPRVIAPCV